MKGRFFTVTLILLILLSCGCGGDTDTVDPSTVTFVEVKPPRVRSDTNDIDIWHADFDVVFQGAPINLAAEIQQIFRETEKINRPPEEKPFTNWEQTGNIVTLHFEFRLSITFVRDFSADPSGPITYEPKILKRKDQKKSVEVRLSWSDGRKFFTVEAFPPESMFVGRSDIADL